jgi:SsrA-binding protein
MPDPHARAHQARRDSPKRDDAVRLVCQNRRAGHDYELEERFEAGMVLLGSEVKSLRAGKMSIAEAFAKFDERGDLWLEGSHINEYAAASYLGHDPRRRRKLLLHRGEMDKLREKVERRGYTLVPTQVYFKGSHAKTEIALARGRHKGDRRAAAQAREAERDKGRALDRSARAAHAVRTGGGKRGGGGGGGGGRGGTD